MRIVVDTAILIRTHAKAAGPARDLLRLVETAGAKLALSPFILQKVVRIPRYPRVQAIYRLEEADIVRQLKPGE